MTEYGPEIPVNGKRPEFVRDGDKFMARQSTGWLECEDAGYFWSSFSVIRLPANHPYYKTQINYDLPVQTRDGRAVRILCTDAPGDYPVVGIVDDDLRTWTIDGVFFNNRTSGNDLINVPAKPERVSRWVPAGVGTGYDTRTTGDNLELIFENGKLVEAVVHD